MRSHFSTTLVRSLLLVSPLLTHALPTPLHRRIFESISVLDSVLLFDVPAFQDPADSNKVIAGMQTFVSLRAIDASGLINDFGDLLDSIGLEIGDAIDTVTERLSLFAAIGLPDKEVEVTVEGCDTTALIEGTSGLPNLGMALRNVSIGSCAKRGALKSTVKADGFLDGREFTATVFSSPPDGFGVISDIDDTIKVSNVLDKLKLAQATLIESPKAVGGMPEVYDSLATSLNDPAFFYVTGSPFQLYPMLHDFINSNYPAGPMFLQNLTLVDIQGLLNFAGNDGDGVQQYKVSQIDKIVGMFPAKKFVAIGDSTQRDPETYAEVFLKYPGTIACSWIRQVDGANNTAERFAEAFKGVPADKFRLFTDDDIPSLATIDVAGGAC